MLNLNKFRWLAVVNLVLLVSFTGDLRSEITLNPYFGDNAVLQRDKPVPIWGWGKPGETVTVEFRDQIVSTTASSDGRWVVVLEAMPVRTEGAHLRVSGSLSSEPVELEDIVVGDVWFCSGQSNMAWTVQRSDNAEEELAAADYPLIRYFRVEFNPAAEPEERMDGNFWRLTTPGTDHAGDNPTPSRVHSAVAYFFARDVYRETGVPIGIIVAARGGTPIESWMSLPSMQASRWWEGIEEAWNGRLESYQLAVELYQQQLHEWEAAAAAARAKGESLPPEPRQPVVIPGGRFMPAGLYNGMVHPFFPMAIRGILWYQGESNAGHHEAHAELFPTMIEQWREAFGQGDLPFYFVQLANFIVRRDSTEETWAFLRESQLEALALPNTGVAIAVDVGNPTDVHPGNKQAVGNRLARLALAHLEGRDIEWSGPVVESITFSGDRVSVSFEHADGLHLEYSVPSGFTLAGSDKVFHPATAQVSENTVHLTAEAVSAPVAVRYAWNNNPAAPLYNGAGLPASPFRSDDWPNE